MPKQMYYVLHTYFVMHIHSSIFSNYFLGSGLSANPLK